MKKTKEALTALEPRNLQHQPTMRLTLIALSLASMGLASAAENSASHTDAPAEVEVGREVKIRLFAFGGVGYGGITTAGENYFFAVLTSVGAKGYVELFERGDAQAKAYALAGLRWLSDERYERLRDAFVAQGGTVRMGQGCLLGDFDVAEIASRIDARQWDEHITAVVKKRAPDKPKK